MQAGVARSPEGEEAAPADGGGVGGVGQLFSPADDDPQGAELSGHGELPRSTRAEILVATLGAVVFPGLEAHGIDTSAGRLWLAGRRPDGAVASPRLRRREQPLTALEEPR